MDDHGPDPDQDNGESADDALRAQIAGLKDEHRDLDAAIAALSANPIADALAIQRLKKKKLFLKDRIAALEDNLVPDIIA